MSKGEKLVSPGKRHVSFVRMSIIPSLAPSVGRSVGRQIQRSQS